MPAFPPWYARSFNMRSWLLLVLLVGCAHTAVRPPVVVPEPTPLPPAEPPIALVQLMGWEGHPVSIAATAEWHSEDTIAAAVLIKRSGDERDIQLALVAGDRLTGRIQLVRTRGQGRSFRVRLSELPIGTIRTLRIDIFAFENGGAGRFAAKTVLVAYVAGTPKPIFARLVESGDRVTDRRALLEARDLDGDGRPELVVEEREAGLQERRQLVYRRGPDGTFTTRDRSIFAE